MSQRLWLLVEWVDERDVFPSYGVVNVGSLIGNETQLHVGKLIFVRDKHGQNTRRAQVLRISDNKQYVKEQKRLVEREDHQVKNVLSLCMRTIREMKSGPMYPGLMASDKQPQSSSSGTITLPQVVADTDDTSSDSDQEIHYEADRHRSRNHRRPAASQNTHYNRDVSTGRRHARYHTPNPRSRSMICSTPVSAVNINAALAKPLLTFDQAIQTDPVQLNTTKERIEEMETVLKGLYSRFMRLVSHMQERNLNLNLTLDMPESPEPNNMESEPEQNGIRSSPEQIPSNTMGDLVNGQSIKGEVVSNPRTLEVRRVSAHTTNTGEPSYGQDYEMVPIGAGNTVVPSRLLNDIDWTSYSTATRQLLQAVFPRRVLATHSLTGKQSPAFMHKPPKKRLDPMVVNDIVDTVAERCGVSKRLVRSSVTIKCTDESKLYRNRQQYKQARQHPNQENLPPAPPSSDESTATE